MVFNRKEIEMKRDKAQHGVLAVLTVVIFLLGMPFLPGSDLIADDDSDDTLAMLSKELKLSDEQTSKLGPAIQKFADTVDGLKADQEKEDAEPNELIQGVKKAEEELNGELKEIFTPDQFTQFNAMKEKAIKGMFNDLAEIQLIDLQPKVGFSDDQLTQLVPILGDGLYQVVTIAWENAGKHLRIGQKIKLAKKLKHIQKESRDAVSKVLTPEQLQTWDKMKEQAKNKK